MPFFKGEPGGTGIGLSTVKNIVDAYHGSIKVHTDDRACFEFTLKGLRIEADDGFCGEVLQVR
ncbi:MAG: HAMP domain-containing histidine kinase [Actinobacteria bacterium]|nr:HAMP domain-containing histidine kinase [Actinomycetota bacterium]